MQQQHPVFRHPALIVRGCEFGWGVFATTAIPEETIVEQAPYLIVPADACNPNILADYVFRVASDPKKPEVELRALVLGWGSIYNHSNEPNIEYAVIAKRRLFQYTTTRKVFAGEQLFVSYGEKWWQDRPHHKG